jgi:polysaccharide export outer membrane protein
MKKLAVLLVGCKKSITFAEILKIHQDNMKKILLPLVAILAVMFMDSCTTSKQVPYMQNIDSISLAASQYLYEARIKPKDALYITVHTTDPAVSAPFNLTVSRRLTTGGEISSGGGSLQSYLVENDGTINFPVVGRVSVVGLTKQECERTLESKIAPYLAKTEKPVVTVRMASFRVTLMGDFSSPKVVPVTTEKMSILEAMASAGDLTLYGKRQNVLLIREDATGKKSVHRIDLTDANFINSPYYYLQQNDVIYVEPNATKAKNSALGQSVTIWFSFISISTSVASLLVNVLK